MNWYREVILITALLMLLYTQKSFANNDLPDDIDISDTVIHDKFEKFNRKIFKFNQQVDAYIFEPTLTWYRVITISHDGRNIVNSALQNLYEPNRMVNSILYGKPHSFFTSGIRFIINSTLGFFGMFDPATQLGIKVDDITFTKVMTDRLCAKTGEYMIIPILGPSTTRNTIGLMVDKLVLDPLNFLLPLSTTILKLGMEILATKETTLEITRELSKISIDDYAALKGLYYQTDFVKEY